MCVCVHIREVIAVDMGEVIPNGVDSKTMEGSNSALEKIAHAKVLRQSPSTVLEQVGVFAVQIYSGVFGPGSALTADSNGVCEGWSTVVGCFQLTESHMGGGSVASQVLHTLFPWEGLSGVGLHTLFPWVGLSGATAQRPVPFFRLRDISLVTDEGLEK